MPDYRNRHHQFYCPKPVCRTESRRVSQQRWLRKPANRDYFRGPENVRRVQQWRKAHSDYWKKKSDAPKPAQAIAPQPLEPSSPLVTQPVQRSITLQDFCLISEPAFIGLISMVTGAQLQEDIASTTRKLEARGRDILGLTPVRHAN